jgi:hypothetical protein
MKKQTQNTYSSCTHVCISIGITAGFKGYLHLLGDAVIISLDGETGFVCRPLRSVERRSVEGATNTFHNRMRNMIFPSSLFLKNEHSLKMRSFKDIF